MIILASFIEGDNDILKILCKEVETTFGECEILDKVLEIPKEAFNRKRRQYNSKYFLEELSNHARNVSDKIVGITDVDLFTQDLNFVFGQALLGGDACIVSLHRLDPGTYKKSDERLFVDRAAKEILHELGHCFGLSHCKDRNCVMIFSNSILDVDFKDKNFCRRCKETLGNHLIKIRPFKPSDLNRVYEIERQSFKDPYHPLFLLNLYEVYHQSFFVAEVNELVVGYVTSRIVEGIGHILAIAVDRKYRRRAIGKALMGRVVEYLLNNGIYEIHLEVRISNKSAIKFYKSLGFREARIIPQYYKDGENGVLLIKELKVIAI
ncbi:MAG: ribosomal protein S18-alanine N-acetyltransferase [Candidatus Hydrothermarchaeales archaeon]